MLFRTHTKEEASMGRYALRVAPWLYIPLLLFYSVLFYGFHVPGMHMGVILITIVLLFCLVLDLARRFRHRHIHKP